jgi:hypothetical protein
VFWHGQEESKVENPCVAPLYFADKAGNNLETPLSLLPAKLIRHCLTGYANWGDLAKLATLQKAWKNTMFDSTTGHDAKWELAQALLEETNGLEHNPARAMALLKQLAGVR